MQTFIDFYILIATIWFFQEWKDTKYFLSSFIIGLFWIYEVFNRISNRFQ